VFIDAEHALDPGYARRIGVDVDNLYISQPDNGEQALDIAETLIKSGNVDCVVSVGGSMPSFVGTWYLPLYFAVMMEERDLNVQNVDPTPPNGCG